MADKPEDVFQKSAEVYKPLGRLDPAGFERHVRFRVEAPPADLAPFIAHFWTIRWDGARGRYSSDEVMHRPYVDVFLSHRDSGIQGTFRGKRTYTAAGSGRIVGMRFRPGAFHAFWRSEMVELQDKVMPLARAFDWADEAGIARVLALDDAAAIAALQARIRSKLPQADATVDLINEIIAKVEIDDDLNTVAAVAAACGRSERWLQQVFRDYLGIGLKWLLQRRRLLAAVEKIRDDDAPDWIGIAYDLGYSSQQHFITDFRTVLGSTPVQYKNGLARSAEK